jgi:hypothetical protein
MRSHAKAPCAGSTEGSGNSRGLLRRALAIRGASGDLEGSGAPSRARGAIAATTLSVLAFALTASPAFGAYQYNLQATFASSQANVNSPVGLGIDNSTNPSDPSAGDIYVTGGNAFNKYTAKHAEEGQAAPDAQILTYPGFEEFPTAYSWAWGAAVDPASGDVYVSDLATSNLVKKYDASGNSVSSFHLDPSINLVQPGGIAVNPANGHVLVSDNYIGGSQVAELDAEGKFTGNRYETPGPVLGVAVDAAGDVYAALGSEGTIKFTEPGATYTRFTANNSGGVAVNPVDQHVFITGGGAAAEYSPSGDRISDFFGVGALTNSYGVAVDKDATHFYLADSNNNAYLYTRVAVADADSSPATEVTRTAASLHGHVDPAGAGKITSCSFEYGESESYGESVPCSEGSEFAAAADVSAAVAGLSPQTVYHFRVAATDAAGTKHGVDQTFETLPAVKGVSTDPATEIRNTAAQLNGSLDPNGDKTDYHFEYVVASTFFESGYASAISVPVPGGDAGEAAGNQPVSAAISGLSPVTTYFFRLIAHNATGQTVGADQTFETLPAVKDLVTEAATAITPGSAQLNGSLDPNGEDAEYHFEYVADADFQVSGFEHSASSPVPDADAGEAAGKKLLSDSISGLLPNTVYDVRIQASNASGATLGNVEQFTTHGLAPDFVEEGSTPTFTEAALRATINPHNEVTSYHFEYGPTDSYGSNTIELTIPAGYGAVQVKDTAQNLTPGAEYHYRIVASNSTGPMTGPDQTFTTPNYPNAGETCPNAAIRNVQGSTFLPECRAYEQVSPIEKDGVQLDQSLEPTYALEDGNAFAFTTEKSAYPGSDSAPLGPKTLSTRSASGWTTRGIDPPLATFVPGSNRFYATVTLSKDLSRALVTSTRKLTPDAPDSAGIYGSLYIREIGTDNYTYVGPGDLSGTQGPGEFFGASDDLKTVVVGGRVWHEGTPGLQPLDIKPDGTLFPGIVGETDKHILDVHQVSSDGSRIYFQGPEGALYLREDGTQTVLVSRSHRAGDSPAPVTAQFRAASPDGRYVIFEVLGGQNLTPDATGGEGKAYRYDVDTDTLTLLASGLYISGPSIIAAQPETGDIYYKTGSSVYYEHEGIQTFLVPVESNASLYWGAQMSPNGKYFALGNYFYEAETDTLSCPSCRTDGGPSLGPVHSGQAFSSSGAMGRHGPSAILNDGTFFFDTPNPLVTADTNGTRDVYSYNHGKLSLLTSGKESVDAQFVNATPDGRNVFFSTTAPLVGQDKDTVQDLYDARVDGGLASQNPASPVECLRDDCKATPSAGPELPFGGSEGLNGPGNVKTPARKRCGKGRHEVKTRGKARCVKQRHVKQPKKRAKNDRRQAR